MMSLGLILEICFVWFLLLAAIGLVLINLSIDVGRFLKRTWKNSEQRAAHETERKTKTPIWKPGLDNAQAASTK
jgi:hypothetical protein